MDLALEMKKILRNKSRCDKYGFGTELRNRSLAILTFVVRANSSDNKREVLEEIRITIEELKHLLLITNKIKARIPVYSWKLQRAVQLELFKTEERKRNEYK